LPSEAAIQTETMRRLSEYAGLRIWRHNTGAAQYGDRVVKFGVPGAADLSGIASPSGRRIEIELKKPGGRQSAAQKSYGAMINKFGGFYICSDDPEAIIETLKQEGIVK
jgi:hypothetical protein